MRLSKAASCLAVVTSLAGECSGARASEIGGRDFGRADGGTRPGLNARCDFIYL